MSIAVHHARFRVNGEHKEFAFLDINEREKLLTDYIEISGVEMLAVWSDEMKSASEILRDLRFAANQRVSGRTW